MEEDRKKRILEYMESDTYKPFLFEELAGFLAVPDTELGIFRSVLDELEAEGKVFKSKKNRYGLPKHFNLIAGRLQMNERGFGFVIPDNRNNGSNDSNGDIYISPEFMHGAMNNDRVYARIMYKGYYDKRAEGEIFRIIQRANEMVVGTFQSSRYFAFVIPDDKRITGDVLIPKDEAGGAVDGQKVVAQIIRWPEESKHAEGCIVEILGDKNSPQADVLSIIRTFNLPEKFPENVMQQVDKIGDTVPDSMLEGRRDLRQLRIVTIDGEDAKDLDDAVSIEKTAEGYYRLGVHIADVSNYVVEGSPLDREALIRGTSVYLADRVIPMLPPKLSNGICSLNPGVDRLTFSVIMTINSSGNVIGHEICESVIKTTERMTYNNVYKMLVENDPQVCHKYSHLIDDFKTMEELALVLRKKRIERGSMDFDFGEAKIILDEEGRPVDIIKFKSTIAEKIIEEFMIVCNETVAEHFFWLEAPFVYRIHEEPDKEKLSNFSSFVRILGYRIKGKGEVHPKALQDLLDEVRGKKEERLISTMLLRSLQKARYSEQNAGHFGLASKYYCHFTAPIRRYPDLLIHKIMKQILKGEMSKEKTEYYDKHLQELARMCSERERAADDAEQAVDDLKKAEYMEQFIGETFEGIITGITNFGMFIELDNTVEGVVRLSSMYDDYYYLDDMRYLLLGEKTGKQYRIGDAIKVKVVKTDKIARQIEFELVNEPNKKHSSKKRSRKNESE
ncbi:MAG TPA: ribonuclease R [Clostridiales bacterium]|nr:ribonuclease R [Clostridiales bacterium]